MESSDVRDLRARDQHGAALVVDQGDRGALGDRGAEPLDQRIRLLPGLDHDLARGVLDADTDLHDLTFPPPRGRGRSLLMHRKVYASPDQDVEGRPPQRRAGDPVVLPRRETGQSVHHDGGRDLEDRLALRLIRSVLEQQRGGLGDGDELRVRCILGLARSRPRRVRSARSASSIAIRSSTVTHLLPYSLGRSDSLPVNSRSELSDETNS